MEKNKLQEYCQKKYLEIPRYESWSKGEPHKLKWYSKVCIVDDNKQLYAESDISHGSKTLSERYVAKLLLNQLNIGYTTQVIQQYKKAVAPQIPTCIKYIYLIDLENRSGFTLEPNYDSLYIGVISATHGTINKYLHWHKCNSDNIESHVKQHGNLLLYTIEGGLKELADHFMTALSYAIADFFITATCLDANALLYIVSADNSGWCTTACMKKIFAWKNVFVEIINVIDLVSR